MGHHLVRAASATLVWSFLAHRGFVEPYTSGPSLILDLVLALLGGLLGYLLFPGGLE